MSEPIDPKRFIAGVTQRIRTRSVARALRLKQEASNCIAIAVSKSGGFTADLIDEAVRLTARARELAAPDNDATPAAKPPTPPEFQFATQVSLARPQATII